MAGWGENFALHVSKMFQEQEAISLVGLETDLDWQQAMFFRAGAGHWRQHLLGHQRVPNQMQRAGSGQKGCAAHQFAE